MDSTDVKQHSEGHTDYPVSSPKIFVPELIF